METTKPELCIVCKVEYTTSYVAVSSVLNIHVCEGCCETAKANFIFVCMNCGSVYRRSKKAVIDSAITLELKKAYMLCEDSQLIQGVDMCVACDPSGIMEFMEEQNMHLC